MNTFELSLDLDKSYTGEPVRLRQGDRRGTEVRATIYDHGEPFTGSYTARYVQAIAGTGHEYYRADATFAAGVATVTVNEEYAAAVAGNAYGYFQFVSGSTVIASTQSFPVIVLPDATADAEVGPEYDSAIEDALAELDEATGRISQMVIDATAEYLEAHPEITTTVQDNSITDAKLVQSGGILQREQWLETMLPNIPRKATSESDVHSVTDSAGGGPLGIEVYGRSTQDGTPTPSAPVAIESVEGNLLDTVSTGSLTDSGVTWTYHADGTITAAGTATANSWSHNSGNRILAHLTAGTYTASVSAPFGLVIYSGSTRLYSGANNSYTFTLSGESDVSVYALVPNGQTVNATTGIMLAVGSAAMPYVPYQNVGLRSIGRNLWAYGNRTFTRYVRVNFDAPLPAGTYTVSAVVTSADTDASTSVFTFRDANDVAVGSATLTRNSRASDVVTIARPATYCYLYSSTGESPSTGDEATWADIQVEVGSVAHAYEPYESVTIPIDLGGRSLRSLPDGTRDEVTVDEWGHAVLTQRVGAVTIDGLTWQTNSNWGGWPSFYTTELQGVIVPSYAGSMADMNIMCECLPVSLRNNMYASGDPAICITSSDLVIRYTAASTAADLTQAFAGMELTYKLLNPQTIDLGYLDPALLPAPDLTAYVVPSAPSVLRYGFDVAAAIAEIATS